ncbi:DNA-binding LacI/PurR family transcriptional regulator [Kineococcus radiotolerans]|uniref:DNA-binding LacI/PurR family transcriptional regulator n=1 Tax=Kineococcus radiotolerans TaxID=131568 RepID=A0A7W4XYH1_KINRA|nr:LacI family DNA-binding transcriptional regulator [Kineococcus radiotolerans]MBB2903166.1 DNA-binding LacI/PurR family transcriptional regulator [Kineococcus radiotolerans]
MAVTLHDVARAAGVSIKTVSNVVRGQGSFSAETRERVETAVAQLGYRPNVAARGLRTGHLGVISLIVPDIRNPYFAELADAVMTEAARHDLLVVIEQSRGQRETELELLRGERTQMVDGILFSALGLTDGRGVAAQVRTPVVVLGEPIPGWPTDHVTMRNTEGAQAATQHLIAEGRRRIAAIGALRGQRRGTAALRLAGYRRALDAAGLPYEDDLVLDVGVWTRSAGADGTRRLLAERPDLDAVVAFNDAMALGAVRVLGDAGRKVPADVAVVGFDDIDETRYSVPALTTIKPGLSDIATTAVSYLRQRIHHPGDALPVRSHQAHFELLVRESSP